MIKLLLFVPLIFSLSVAKGDPTQTAQTAFIHLSDGKRIAYNPNKPMNIIVVNVRGEKAQYILDSKSRQFVLVNNGKERVIKQQEQLNMKPQKTTPFDDIIHAASQKHHLDATLIKAVIHVESGFNPRARSPKSAMGLMQLVPETARRFGVRDPYDPVENIRGGTRYLRELLDMFDGDVALALAGYNAGEQRVKKYGGIPPFRETQDYVRKVLQLARHYENLR